MKRTAGRATARACATAAGVTLVVLVVPMLLFGFYFGMDLNRLELGLLCTIQHQLHDDTSLWLSPFLGNGSPLLLRPGAQLLYPPRWVATLLPLDLATSWTVLFHLTGAAAAAAWLARTFRVRPFGAFCAGLIFAFSGTALDLVLHPAYIVGAIWLPLAWAAARRAAHVRGEPWHIAVCAAALALCLLAGEPQVFCIASALVLLEALRAPIKHGRHQQARWSTAIRLVAAIVGAFGIGLLVWGGTLTEMQLAVLGRDLGGDAAFWSATTPTWPAFLLPAYLHGHVQPMTHVWAMLEGGGGEAMPWNRQPYVGSLFLAAFVCGCFARRARLPAIVAVLGLTLAMGDQLPVLDLLSRVVPLGLFRYPAKYLLVATLAASMVVALTFDHVRRCHAVRRRLTWAGGTVLVGLAVASIVVVAGADALDRLAASMFDGPTTLELDTLSTFLRGCLVHSAAPLALALVALYALPKSRGLLIALVVVDLLVAAPTSLKTGPGFADMASPLPRVLADESRPVVCVDPHLLGRRARNAELNSDWGQMMYYRTLPVTEMNACDRVRMPVGYGPLRGRLDQRLLDGLEKHNVRAARALGCTHWITEVGTPSFQTHPIEFDAPWWQHYLDLFGVVVYAIDDPIPESFVVSNPVLHPSEEEVDRALQASGTLEQTLAVIDDPIGRWPQSPALPSGTGVTIAAPGWADSDRLSLTVGGTGGAVVGARTSYLVGWVAEQSGTALPTVRVGGKHLGVVVQDASRGPISLRYESPRFSASLAAAVMGAGLIALACAHLHKRRRHRAV
ncbi:MAG: hypothetical protein V3T05_05380 [Myxococcota bacterium]